MSAVTFGEMLVEAMMCDSWPSLAVVVDFGIVNQEMYEAYYYPIRSGEVSARQLDAAKFRGPVLSELLSNTPYHKARGKVVIVTPYDNMTPIEEEEWDTEPDDDRDRIELEYTCHHCGAPTDGTTRFCPRCADDPNR